MPKMDPLLLVPAMAAVTTNLAFGITASTTYELPFALARRYGTLDHLTNGRIAWNIVTYFNYPCDLSFANADLHSPFH